MCVGLRLRPACNPLSLGGRVLPAAFRSVCQERRRGGYRGNIFPDRQHRIHSEHRHELLSRYAQRYGQALEKHVPDDLLLHHCSDAFGLSTFPSGLWAEWNLGCSAN